MSNSFWTVALPDWDYHIYSNEKRQMIIKMSTVTQYTSWQLTLNFSTSDKLVWLRSQKPKSLKSSTFFLYLSMCNTFPPTQMWHCLPVYEAGCNTVDDAERKKRQNFGWSAASHMVTFTSLYSHFVWQFRVWCQCNLERDLGGRPETYDNTLLLSKNDTKELK